MSKKGGIKVVNWKGLKVTGDLEKQAMEGLTKGGDVVLAKSNEIVPHRTGLLQSSGIVSSDANKLRVAVSYNTPYAKRIHEHPTMRFRKNRKGKWLEITINNEEVKQAAKNALVDALKQVLR